MTEEVKTVRDPLLVITAPARVPTLGEDFAAYDTALVDACEAELRRRGWRVKETANVRLMDHRFAGSDAARPRACRKPLTKWTQTLFCVFGAATGRQGSFQKLTGRERARAAPRLWV